MYNLNEILELIEAIKAIDNSDILSRKQKSILKRAYSLYTKNNGIVDTPDSFIYKKVDTYSLVFDYIYDNKFNLSNLDIDTRKKIQLFKALLNNKNKNISLKKLYEEVYKGIYDEDIIEEKFNNPSEREKFFSELNGCLLEEMVANIDLSNLDPSNLGTIKIDVGDKDNPLVFISGLNISVIPTIDISDNKDVTILTFSDLHLDNGCFEVDMTTGLPVLNQDKLEDNLLAFVNFRDKVISDLERQGVRVAGIVFTGDIFEALTLSGSDENKPTNFIKTNRTDLMNGFIKFQRSHGDILSMPDKINGEASFVSYIAGNHDMTLGKKIFDQMMKLFRSDAINLGNGSARIKLGNDFISFMHHDALDWGLAGWDLKFTTRKIRNKNTFHFNDYFEICKKCYDTLVTDKASCSTSDLVKLVSEKMKKENPELYRYFLPYTIPNSILKISNKQPITADEETRRKINATIPFFANFMYIDKNAPYELKKKASGMFDPDPMKFYRFISGGVKVQEVLAKEGLYMPQFGRNDSYCSILTSLAHFHTKLSGPNGGSYRISFGAKRGKQKYFPVAVSEGSTHYEERSDGLHFEFSAMQYNFKVKNGKVSRIGIIPLVADLKKVSVDGRVEFEGTLDKKPEDSFTPRKRH